MLEKEVLIPALMPSIAVKIPTKAIIPIEIMSAVIMALNLFPLMEVRAILRFSDKVIDFG
jgi:hypothetical protein